MVAAASTSVEVMPVPAVQAELSARTNAPQQTDQVFDLFDVTVTGKSRCRSRGLIMPLSGAAGLWVWPGPTGRPDIWICCQCQHKSWQKWFERETGQTVRSEQTLTLSAGDTLAKILRKAKFTNQDVASVSQALSRHLNLRRLQIGTQFTAGLDDQDKAVALKVSLPAGRQSTPKTGHLFVDHYVLRDLSEQAENTLACYQSCAAG